MADEQKPDPSLLKLATQRQAASARNESTRTLSRTPSFRDWMEKGWISQTSRPSSIRLPSPRTTSSPRPQNQMGQTSMKNEPWSPPSELACPQSLAAASIDWIGPTKRPNDKFQSHHSSYAEPAMVPFSTGSPKLHSNKPAKSPRTDTAGFELQIPKPCADRIERQNQVKLLPKPDIPTRPRSSLKRKTIGSEQLQPHQNPPPPPSSANTIMKSVHNLLCEICHVSCSSALTMQQHLKGRPHKAKLKYRQLKTACKGDRKGKPRCDICEIWCSDRAALDMHLKGQKHKAKLQELELCKRNGGEKIAKTPILCELCLVPCMNEDTYKMHLKGRQHAIREELNRRGML